MVASERTVQSVERSLDLLEAIAGGGPAGVTELARRCGLHVATAHNLLRTLAARHYLVNDSGRYRLGPAAAVLASSWDPLAALPDLLQPLLVEIAATSGEAASATVLLGDEARLIAFQPGTEAITIHYPQWLWPQALKLATARLLVALGEPTRWDVFIDLSPEVCPEWGREQWRARLAAIRAAGWCALRTDRDGGQVLFAAPVRTIGGRPVAALGAACPAFRAGPERCDRMTAAVWRAAAAASAALGGELSDEVPQVDWTVLPLDHQADEAGNTGVSPAGGEGDET